MEIENTKIWIKNEDECEVVQKALFKLGCSWGRVGCEVINRHAHALFIDGRKQLGYISDDDRNYFYSLPNREIFVKDLLKGKLSTKPENLTRFMAYGMGCNNKSDLYETEKELREKLRSFVSDSSWTGKIVGYKLIPLYEAEKSVKLTKLLKTKKSKKK